MARVLLIDDDTVLLKLYSTRLTADHHQVAVAANGEEGLRQVAQFKPDIIILDLLMPKINGFAFLETLKRHTLYSQIKVLVFSSVANQEQINRLNSLGVKTFLNKIDTSPTQLVRIIQNELNLITPANLPQPPA